jgi:DNA polymerase III alpha subunit
MRAPLLLNTPLKNRTLWFDGASSYDPSTLSKVVRMYDVEFVDFVDDTVYQYNQMVSKEQELTVKTGCKPLDYGWNIPEAYKTLDVVEYISEKHLIMTANFDEDDCNARDDRLAAELKLFKKHGLFDVLRTVIFIINKLTTDDVVWGVGRGSSVSSYALYVIGVHDVDSFLYDLDINDFISE